MPPAFPGRMRLGEEHGQPGGGHLFVQGHLGAAVPAQRAFDRGRQTAYRGDDRVGDRRRAASDSGSGTRKGLVCSTRVATALRPPLRSRKAGPERDLGLLPVHFFGPLASPDVRVSRHPALPGFPCHRIGCRVHGVGMFFAHHRYRVTSTVAASNITIPFSCGRFPGLPRHPTVSFPRPRRDTSPSHHIDVSERCARRTCLPCRSGSVVVLVKDAAQPLRFP